MNYFPLILALNFQEWFGAIAFGIVLILRVIGQINESKKRASAPPRPPQRVPQVPPGEAAGGKPIGDPLREQVDDFLRRVQESRAPGATGATPARPPRMAGGRDEVEILLDDANLPASLPPRGRVAGPPRTSGSGPAKRQPQPPRERKPPRKQRTSPSGSQSVAEHVATNVVAATKQIEEDVSRLGERVKKADADFDVQLQHKFDHGLGSLDARHASRLQEQMPAESAPSQAAQMAALLSSPDGIRQAIVLNEILRRPEERW